MFKYSNTNKRYHTLDYYYKTKYNSKIFKITLNQNCSCPNIDGTKGFKGCIYCKNGSGENRFMSLKEQFELNRSILHKKWPEAKYIAYFQANSNTYGDIEKLKNNFYEVLTYENVLGINIATRCDCINDEVINMLNDLNRKTDLVVELGLQTSNDKTLKLINTCYTKDEFDKTLDLLIKNNIKVVVHIINGLPFETKEDMLETVKYLNSKNIFGIKIHMLHILKNTELEKLYDKSKFHVLEKLEYVNIVCDQLELLRPEIVINRVTGDPKVDDLVEPTWLIKKFTVLNEIDKELVRRDSYQGKVAVKKLNI